MKALLFSLRPDALAEGGLLAALEGQAHALRTRYGLEVDTRWEAEPSLSPAAQTAAYRIAQEALHNVVKHAGASRVQLEAVTEGDGLRLRVEDNGQGFDPEQIPAGTLGQRSMRERATDAGGQLQVSSTPGRGTAVTLWLPLQGEHPAAHPTPEQKKVTP